MPNFENPYDNDSGYNLPRGYGPEDEGMVYEGGSKYFDESTGQYQPAYQKDTIGSNGIVNPKYEKPSGSNTGGGFNFDLSSLPSWLQDALGGLGSGLTNAASNPQLIPALAQAYHFYNQADKYGNMGTDLAKTANPFGDRQMYRQGLDDLYTNPDSIANTAAYKFRLDQGLGALGPQLAAKGGGFGNQNRSIVDYASGLAATEYDKEWQRRFEAAGGKFDPANAAKLQLDAARLEAESKGAALDSLFTPFKPGANTTINNGAGGSSGGIGGTGIKASDVVNGVLKGGAGLQSTVSAIYGGGQGALSAISAAMASGAKFIDLGNGTMIDLEAAARSMGGVDGAGGFAPYPTDGGIGNYGPETPIETPTDPYTPMVPDPTTIDVPDVIPTISEWYDFGGQ